MATKWPRQFQYIRYDGGTKFPTIAKQNDFLLEAGYYVHQAKVQPFLKYETQAFVDAANASKDINRMGFGRELLHPRPEPEMDAAISARACRRTPRRSSRPTSSPCNCS